MSADTSNTYEDYEDYDETYDYNYEDYENYDNSKVTPIPFQENESQLVYAKFHSFTITVDLQWADLTKKTVKLKKINEHCHYKGFFEEDPKSVILITGCENELQSIQIQSGLFGDTLATTTNGTLEIVFGADLREDMVDNPEFEEENIYILTITTTRRVNMNMNSHHLLPSGEQKENCLKMKSFIVNSPILVTLLILVSYLPSWKYLSMYMSHQVLGKDLFDQRHNPSNQHCIQMF